MSRKIRERAIPKYKKDWPGKTLLMKEACPTTRMPPYGYEAKGSALAARGPGNLVTLERFPRTRRRPPCIGHL